MAHFPGSLLLTNRIVSINSRLLTNQICKMRTPRGISWFMLRFLKQKIWHSLDVLVGLAVGLLTCWLVPLIFDRCFLPCLPLFCPLFWAFPPLIFARCFLPSLPLFLMFVLSFPSPYFWSLFCSVPPLIFVRCFRASLPLFLSLVFSVPSPYFYLFLPLFLSLVLLFPSHNFPRFPSPYFCPLSWAFSPLIFAPLTPLICPLFRVFPPLIFVCFFLPSLPLFLIVVLRFPFP